MIPTDLVPYIAAGGVQLAGLLIWGATMTNRVKTQEADLAPLKGIDNRVKTLEAELIPLKGLDSRLARMETQMTSQTVALAELNASVRWMRDPGVYAGKHHPE